MSRGRKIALDPDIKAHYEAGAEKDRLLKGISRLEFHRTKQIISRYLPAKPMKILDIGGGPGFYSRWLAELGHTVHLVDPISSNIRQAQEMETQSGRKLASISLGDARSLDFENGSFDLVLMLGPLYHLIERRDRMSALSEAFRVLKPEGRIFAGAISRFTSALDGSFRGFIKDPVFVKIVERDLKEGQHRNPKNHPEYFTTAFFHHPDQLRAEVANAGFEAVKVFSVCGFGWLLPKFDEFWADSDLKAQLLSILEATETEPSMIGLSDHLLAVGSKKSLWRILRVPGRLARIQIYHWVKKVSDIPRVACGSCIFKNRVAGSTKLSLFLMLPTSTACVR